MLGPRVEHADRRCVRTASGTVFVRNGGTKPSRRDSDIDSGIAPAGVLFRAIAILSQGLKNRLTYNGGGVS